MKSHYPLLLASAALIFTLVVCFRFDLSPQPRSSGLPSQVPEAILPQPHLIPAQIPKRLPQEAAFARHPKGIAFFERTLLPLPPIGMDDERMRRSILSRQAIKVDLNTLKTVRDIGSGFLDIQIGENASVTASVGRVIDNWGGGYSLSGKLASFPMGTFMATVHGESLVVNVRTGDEKTGDFEILPNALGGHEIRHVDGSSLPSCDAAIVPPQTPVGGGNSKPLLKSPEAGENLPSLATAGDGPIIDLLVVYTRGARNSRGGTDGMVASINQAVNEGNLALSLSHVSATFRLAHSAEVSYTETGDSSVDLNRLRGKSEGEMDDVHALRDEYGADIVSLWTQSSYSGIGYLLTNLSGSFESSAFNVCDVDYAVGSYTMAHECGHNMGGHHDIENAGYPGLYSYSYGSRWLGTNGSQYRSVMAYPPGTRVLRFSNPAVTYNGGVTGSSSADNARTINNSCLTVSNFRAEVAGSGLMLSSSYADISPDAGSNSFNVIAQNTWSWSQSAGSDWLIINEASSQTGNQTFSYAVTDNILAQERTAIITITQDFVTRSHTITQKGSIIDDHGNSISLATTVAQNSTTPGNIGTPGDNDYFRIDVTESGTLVVGTTGQSDTYGYLLNSTGVKLSEGDDADTANFSIRYDVMPGTYYVRVRLFNESDTGSYQLACSLSSVDALSLDSAGRSVPAKGGTYSFEVYSNTTWTWSDDVSWVTSPESVSQDGDQVFIFTVGQNTSPGTRTANITFVVGNRRVTYALSQAGTINDDHGNTTASATVVAQNSSVAGSIETYGDEDFFKIVVLGSGVLIIKTIGFSDTYGYLLDAAGNELASNDDGADTNFFIRRSVTAGTYYVRVRHYGFSSIGVYRLVSSWTAAVDGENLVGWGMASDSQAGIPTGLTGVVAVATGRYHTLALKGNGNVVAWGNPIGAHTMVPYGLTGVIAVAGGASHSMALKSDGKVVFWGQSNSGQSFIPVNLADLKGVVAIASGWYHCLALKSDGRVVLWGENSSSQLNAPSNLMDVTAIAAGAYHSLALKTDGTVTAWGSNENGQCDVPAYLNDVIAVSAGERHSVALRANGSVVGWGDPYLAAVPPSVSRIVSISAGSGHTLARKQDGTVLAWGYGIFGETIVPATFEKAIGICAGNGSSYAIKEIQGTEPEVHIYAGASISAPEILNDGSTQANFGELNLVGSRKELTFTVANKGLTALHLNSAGAPRILISGEHAQDFKLVSHPSLVVASGTATTFKIAFDPSVKGDRYATVRVITGDLDNSPFIFGIEGSGQDLQKPTLKLTTQSGKLLSTTSPMKVLGTAKDNTGIDRVEIVFNNSTPFQATLESPEALETAFTAFVEPVIGFLNSLTVSVYDTAGNSVSITKEFIFELRYGLTLTREVPLVQMSTPDKAGTVSLGSIPAKSASALTKGPEPQTSDVLAGTALTVTATAKAGHLFSHWEGLPEGTAVAANVVTFTMPAESVTGVKAVFVDNDINAFLGGKTTVFQGLLRPDEGVSRNNSTVGFLSASLAPAKGTLSGKFYHQGAVIPFTAVMHGNGSVWFKEGKTYVKAFNLHGSLIELIWTGNTLNAELTGPGGVRCTGVARSATPAEPAMLDAKGKLGYYTMALPAKIQTTPLLETHAYPQGAGYGTFTLTNKGAVKLSGMLADGSAITMSTFLTEGEHSDLFIQLPTPGGKTKKGTFLGTLNFNPNLADSDVAGQDLIWIRPQADDEKKAPEQIYTAGWPEGIVVDALGTLFNGSMTVQSTLGLPAADMVTGNAVLSFAAGKLASSMDMTQFNIVDSKVHKLTASDKSFALTITAKTGLFKGSFTPNWTSLNSKLPGFQGVMLQKGPVRRGYGYFISNRLVDLDPESGMVWLKAQE